MQVGWAGGPSLLKDPRVALYDASDPAAYINFLWGLRTEKFGKKKDYYPLWKGAWDDLVRAEIAPQIDRAGLLSKFLGSPLDMFDWVRLGTDEQMSKANIPDDLTYDQFAQMALLGDYTIVMDDIPSKGMAKSPTVKAKPAYPVGDPARQVEVISVSKKAGGVSGAVCLMDED